jgi:hypothetical protein
MVVRDGKLRCEFSSEDSKTTLSVETGRSLSVVWSTPEDAMNEGPRRLSTKPPSL